MTKKLEDLFNLETNADTTESMEEKLELVKKMMELEKDKRS